MFLHHNDVHSLGILECQKAEAPRPTGSAITHDGAFNYLTKL